MALPAIHPADLDPKVRALWSMSRRTVEESVYKPAFASEDKDAIRWLARNDRYFLMTCLLGRADARHDWLYHRCREVEADPDDNVDLWARDHYKSSIITFAGIVQEILRDPEITIGIFSHDKPTAKVFLKQIKLEFESNKTLLALFPDIFWENPKRQAPSWSEDGGIIVKRKGNPKECTVEASGLVDGMSTGRHFALRVYDDVVTETSVTTPDMIRKTTFQYDLSQNLGTRDGRLWLIGTRYHFNDTYGQVLARKVLTERRHAATADGSIDGKPVFLTEKQWARKKAESTIEIIACQQLLNPLAGKENTFDIRWLKFWDIRPKRLNVYIMGDPSKGKHRESDNTAIAVVGVDINQNKYLLDGFRHRMTLTKRWQVLRDLYWRWAHMPGIQTVQVGYEQFGMQTDLEYFEERMEIESREKHREIGFPIEELSWTRQGQESKQFRIERLEPDFRMGRLRIPEVVEIDEEGTIVWIDPTRKKNVQEIIAAGEKYRVAQPIRQINQDKKVYDVLAGFLEEYTFFPFAALMDFLDALSRIYDMNPQPPVLYSHEAGRATSVEPECFADT